MDSLKKKRLIVSGSLLLLCVGFYIAFTAFVNDYCFRRTANLHIIDSHIMYCGIDGLFDGDYVEEAAPAYNKEKYRHSYLIVDSLFPIAYSAFFISLLSFVKENTRRLWFIFFIALVVIGALFDYGENFSFLYYLEHPSKDQADRVAFFTSIKSLLVLSNFGIGIITVVYSMIFIRLNIK